MLQVKRLAELSAQIATAMSLELDQNIVHLGLDFSIETAQGTGMEEHLHRGRGKDKGKRNKVVLRHHCWEQARLT